MIRRPPRSTRTDTLFPYTTLFRSTPIFAENSGTGGNPRLRTTSQAFGDKLHTYTIVDAINDKNVLPFRIDYINTIKAGAAIHDKQVSAIDTERALLAPERLRSEERRVGEECVRKCRSRWATSC